MYWLLFSAPTISVLWVAFGVYFFSFYTRYLFSLIGFVFLSWSPNFSSSNFSSAAVLLAKSRPANMKHPDCEVGSVFRIPSIRNGVRLGFLPWLFLAGWCPWMLTSHFWAVWQWLWCSSPDIRASPSQLWRRLAVHGSATQAAPSSLIFIPSTSFCAVLLLEQALSCWGSSIFVPALIQIYWNKPGSEL